MDEVLRLLRENNMMLRAICNFIYEHQKNKENEDSKDFVMNVIANIISNRRIGDNGQL